MTAHMTRDQALEVLAQKALATHAADYVYYSRRGLDLDAAALADLHRNEPTWPDHVARAEADADHHRATLDALAGADLDNVGCPDCGARRHQRCRPTCLRYTLDLPL